MNEDASRTGEPDLPAIPETEIPPAEVIPRKEHEDLHDKYLRLHAEFDNFRKRTEREKREITAFANEKLLLDLLPVLDNLELALRHARESETAAALAEGVDLVVRQFKGLLERYGISVIEASGQAFDPRYHEALAQVESAAHRENTVIEELQRGYLLGGKAIRPARVIVSRRPLLPPPGRSGSDTGSENQ